MFTAAEARRINTLKRELRDKDPLTHILIKLKAAASNPNRDGLDLDEDLMTSEIEERLVKLGFAVSFDGWGNAFISW